MSAEHNQHAITEGVIYKQLLYFFFPILLGTFFQQLYNTTDAVIIGNFVGKEALGAVGGTTATIINLLVGFFVGLSSGATVIVSQHYGAGREQATRRAVHTAAALALASGIIITLIGVTFSGSILRTMKTPENIFPLAVTYIRIYFGGMVFSMIYNMGCGILRAAGDSKRPLYYLIASTMINVVLDLLFVVVFKLGVAGAAVATVISQAISSVLVTVRLCRVNDIYRLDLKKIRFDKDILKHIVMIGFPAGLQSVMYGLSNVIIQSSINKYDTDTIAAWTAYGKIDGVFWMVIAAFGVSVTTFSGQNFGARKYDRIKKSLGVSTIMAMGAALLISTVVLLFGRYILRLFTPEQSVIAVGITMIQTLVPFYFTYVMVELICGVLRGTGDSLIPMLITGFGICVLRVVWIFTAVPLRPELSTTLYCYPITWAATSVIFLIYYFRGGWLKRRIAKEKEFSDIVL